MINKQGLWFLTLFSLILVLSVYYVTMPNELFLTNTKQEKKEEEVRAKEVTKEENTLTAMRVELDEKRRETITSLEETINSQTSNKEEKNKAYEDLKSLNKIKGTEEDLEAKLKKEFKLDSFIKIEDNQIIVVIVKKDHDKKLANQIMRSIQKEFEEKKYISIKFQK